MIRRLSLIIQGWQLICPTLPFDASHASDIRKRKYTSDPAIPGCEIRDREKCVNKGRDSKPSEWKLHWPLLLAATFGISFGSIPISTLGLFMEPLQAEFGWSRTTISLSMTVFAFIVTPLTPFAGALVDRFGARAVAIPGLVLCGLFFAGFSLMNGVVALWIGMWIAFAAASLLIRTMVWNPPVATAFVANRGVAMAIMLSGMSVASATVPLLTHWLIGELGWRGTYIALGLGWPGIALLLVIPFFRVAPVAKASADGDEPHDATQATRFVPGGLTLREALRSITIIRIALACFLATLIGAAWGVHMVPIYISFGVDRGIAASLAIVAGTCAIIARLVAGSIMDRFNSGVLPFVMLALPAAAYALLLASGGTFAVVVLAAAIIGIGGGATLYMIIYLTTQYAGLRHFGKIYGSVSALTGLSSGIGPVTAGWIFDTTGNYETFLMIGIPVFVVAGLLVYGLGPHPQFEPEEVSEPAR
jgi:MFS family permease